MEVHILQCELEFDSWLEWTPSRFEAFVRDTVAPLLPHTHVDLLVLPPHLGTLALLAVMDEKPTTMTDFLPRVKDVQRQAEDLWLSTLLPYTHHATTICAGTWYCDVDGEVYHEAKVLESHEVIGTARQTHRYGIELEWPLRRSNRLEPIESSVGRLGMLVGSDVMYPEVARILSLQETDLLVCLPTIREPYSMPKQWSRLWSHVQSNQMPGVESGLCGQVLDVKLAGRAAAITLCDTTADLSGYVGRINGMGRIAAAYDLDKIALVRQSYPILEMANRKLYQAEIEALSSR